MTLTEFLLARIAEDEAGVCSVVEQSGEGGAYLVMGMGSFVFGWDFEPDRLLAESEAKRRIVERATDYEHRVEAAFDEAEYICRILAAVYSDHPDYDEAWRP